MNGLQIEISTDDATFSSEGEFGNVSFNNIDQLCGPDAAASLLSFPVERIHPLGQGSSSIVYKSLILNRLCVVAEKVFIIGDSKKKIQLFRELQSLKSICSQKTENGINAPVICPFIVQLLEVFSNPQDGTLSLCLEYMDCGSLENVVQNGGCRDESVLSSITYQMLSGLQFLHEMRLIHRDVKPSNALISSGGRVKLADFGLARTLDNGQSLANSFVGTFLYMAPERLTGESYSFQSDIWSLGLTIHAVALGRFPYLGKSGYWEVLSATQQGPPPIQSEFSNEFQQFLSLTYQLEVNKRPNAAILLALSFTQSGVDIIPEHQRYLVCRNLDTEKRSSSLPPVVPIAIPQISIPAIAVSTAPAVRSAVSGQPQSAPCTASGNLTFRPRDNRVPAATTASSVGKGAVSSCIATARGQICSSARTVLTQHQQQGYTGAARSTAAGAAALRSLSGRSAAIMASSNSARLLSYGKGQSGLKAAPSTTSRSGKTTTTTTSSSKMPMARSTSTATAMSTAGNVVPSAQRKTTKTSQAGSSVNGHAKPLTTSAPSSVNPWARSVSATTLNSDKNIGATKSRHTKVSTSEKIQNTMPSSAPNSTVAVASEVGTRVSPQQNPSRTQAQEAMTEGDNSNCSNTMSSLKLQHLVQVWEKYVTLARQKQLHTDSTSSINPARRLLGAHSKETDVVTEVSQPVESYDYVASPSTAVRSLRRLVSRQHASREMYVTEETIGRLARTLPCDAKTLRAAFWSALERIDAAWQGCAVQRIVPGKVASSHAAPAAVSVSAASTDSVCGAPYSVNRTPSKVTPCQSPKTRVEINTRVGNNRTPLQKENNPCSIGGISQQQHCSASQDSGEDVVVEEGELQEDDLLLEEGAAVEEEGELDESIEEMLDLSALVDDISRDGDDQEVADEEVSDEEEGRVESEGIEDRQYHYYASHRATEKQQMHREEQEDEKEEDVYADESFEDFTE